jgi:hypothetical protein
MNFAPSDGYFFFRAERRRLATKSGGSSFNNLAAKPAALTQPSSEQAASLYVVSMSEPESWMGNVLHELGLLC